MVDPVLAALGMVVEGFAQEVAGHLVRRRQGGAGDLTPPKVRRLLKGTSTAVAKALRNEIAGLSDDELQAAVLAVRDSFAAVSPFRPGDALAHDLQPESLVAYLRAEAVEIRRAAALSSDGEAAYDRMLIAACEALITSVMALPGFLALAHAAELDRMQTMLKAIQKLERKREQAEEAADAASARFQRRYLDHVARTLGRLELFGVSRGREPRSQAFDRAYVSLAVARSDGSSGGGSRDGDLTGAGVEVRTGFQAHRRVLLRGGAGAGKTTLLRWLAVDAARDTLGERRVWDGMVPFLVALREFAQRPFPAPEALPEAIASVIAAEMPPGWAQEQFGSGRALLLVDGVDELAPARRAEARAWLESIVGSFPEVQVVVSSRPFSISEDWLGAANFVAYDLLPLSREGVRAFVRSWHDAARDECADDDEATRWLDDCEQGLLAELHSRLDLARLASGPLVCGLLCALYRDRGMHLPRDRRGLFEDALELLLVRWDEQRGIEIGQLPSLSLEEQVVLLQRFAYSMVKNHEQVVPRDEAERRITHAMRGLRSQDVPADGVLQRTLERTGVLNEPSPDKVEFIHRTFLDFLAAKEVVDAGELPFLVEQAHLDPWTEVVINAVALARPAERDKVLRTLLDGNTAAGRDLRLRSRLHLVAAACLEHADVLDSDEARRLVEEATARLIPPRSLDEAEFLGRAGEFVLALLPGPEGLSVDEAAAVVRTIAIIGGPGTVERLAAFVSIGESRVIDELLRAWRHSHDLDSYARVVLAEVDFGDRTLDMRGWHRITCLPHLDTLTSVECNGDFADLKPLAAMPNLQTLELKQNEMVWDLRPLQASTTLTTLKLTSGCQFLEDLSPLADTPVERLELHLLAKVNLATLRPGRLRALAIRDVRLADDGLHPLPADLALQELVVDNLPSRRNLRGIERWPTLERVAVFGLPDDEEVAALARLPRLATLQVRGVVDRAEAEALRERLPGVVIEV